MNVRGVITAAASALLAAALWMPASSFAYDRDHDGGRYHGDHHRRQHYSHHHGHPPHGRAYGYYAPRYPEPHYYRPYYPSHYYYPAPRYYYGPDSGWSVDLHYFFRD